jgi:hypothetical protein
MAGVCEICRVLYDALSRVFWPDFDRLTYTHRPELVKSVDGHGSCSLTALLLFRVYGLTICEQLPHKIMPAFIVMLPSNCCCGDFSAVSEGLGFSFLHEVDFRKGLGLSLSPLKD